MVDACQEIGFVKLVGAHLEEHLFIVIKNPLTRREYERICVSKLEQKYNVRIFDCTKLVFPAANRDRGSEEFCPPNLVMIDSFRELNNQLKDISSGFVIDYVGNFSTKTILLFHLFKRRGISLVVVDSGPVPSPVDGGRFAGLISRISSLTLVRLINRILFAVAVRIFDSRADIAIVAGNSWKTAARFSSARMKIPAHSFDYEEYLQKRKMPKMRTDRYAVYLDEDIVNHRDNVELGLAHPATEEKFFRALRRLFVRFEQEADMHVVVAGYPSARYDLRPHLLNGVEIVTGKTADLISGAEVVFMHASTALSFAVLWRRPTVFLTSDEIAESWYHPRIQRMREILNAPMINIDRQEATNLSAAQWKGIDESAYQSYQDTYIKSKGSPEISLWSIFMQVE
jgi:hypothetical protein